MNTAITIYISSLYNIKKMFLSKGENKEIYLFILIVTFVQLLLSFQGFDVCDEGFSLTHYQQIFNDPSCVEYNSVYWLSGLIGGLWYEIYPTGGILWFRILAVVFNVLTFIVSFKILEKIIDKRSALFGCAMVVFVNDFGYLAFYHNHLTAFLAVVGIYILVKGILESRLKLVVFSGFIIGVNVFTRLPNATLLIFVLAIPFYYFITNKSFKIIIKPSLLFFVGVFLGIISIILLLISLNQFDELKNATATLFNLGKSNKSGHNISEMFFVYVRNYISMIKYTVVFLFVVFTYLLFSNSRYFLINLGIKIVAFFMMFFLLKKGGMQLIYGFCFIGTITILFFKNVPDPVKLTAFLALLMTVFLPLGSSGGMNSSGYMCIWLSLPFFLFIISNTTSLKMNLTAKWEVVVTEIQSRSFKKLYMFVVVSFFAYKLYAVSQEAYFDKGNRFNKTYTISSKFAKGIYTKKRRAHITNTLLSVLETYVRPDDYLLIYDKLPMIHFLTNTKPYMYNPWVFVYDGVTFEKKLIKAEKEIKVLPIVVQQKFETIYEFSKPVDDYMNETKINDHRFNQRRTKNMNAFLKRNDYEIVWSNAYFNIYKSQKYKLD